jgi:hypothetical protein
MVEGDLRFFCVDLRGGRLFRSTPSTILWMVPLPTLGRIFGALIAK